MNLRRAGLALAASASAVGAISVLVFALEPVAPNVSLGVLYVLAVVPVAVVWGIGYALLVSLASMLAFNFFFLAPVHSFTLRDSENWTALAVYLVTAVSVSQLASAARRRAVEAEERERQATLLADVSANLLRSADVPSRLGDIAALTGSALGAKHARIELESFRRPSPHEAAYPLEVDDRRVGTLFVDAEPAVDQRLTQRLLPALASVLAVAADRERLAHRAVEAETFRRSDALKTAILRAVSHDLRSPLTAIRAAAEGLGTSTLELDAADRAALLETIELEARRLDRLVGNLLDLSRLEAGAAEPRPELRSAEDLVAGALDELGVEGDRIRFALPDGQQVVRADAAQVERILVNLLENALKFSPPDSVVEVAVVREETEVVISIADAGPGLAAHELERIFEPFLPGRRADGRAGSGLGLAIVRGFAEANGGRVWVRSEGTGAIFCLALPAAELPAAAPV